MPDKIMKTITSVLPITAFAILTGCQSIENEPFPEPLRAPVEVDQNADNLPTISMDDNDEARPLYVETPKSLITTTIAKGEADDLGELLSGPPITISFSDAPLKAFINEVFGTQLGLSFVVSPGLQEKTDLVTLRLTEPLTPSALFRTARTVLAQYGVGIKEENGLLNFVASSEVLSNEVPLLISGRTLPEVPATHRTIFQLFVPKIVKTPDVVGLIRQAFSGSQLILDEDGDRNAVMLRGPLELVQQAVEMIKVLDQPLLTASHSLIVQPEYLTAKELADELSIVLKAEGYKPGSSPGGGSQLLIPLKEANRLFIFATDESVLEHIKDWIKVLDEKRRDKITDRLFTYEIRHHEVEKIITTLNSIVTADSSSSGEHKLVAEKEGNLIIFKGSGKKWGELLALIKALDKPIPSVLVEVLLAEVSLSDATGSGIEFLFRGSPGRFNLTGSTLNSLGISSKGLSLVLDNAGATRALIDLFYENAIVNIRSSPRLLVKSGGTATIEVGNEIPVITQNTADNTTNQGTTNILQEISYRKTGVILKIKPTVHGGMVNLEIDTELSEARPTDASSLQGSPTILNRSIKTELTLKDGGSLLMGGMISNSQSGGDKGIPGMAKIPLLGRLFRSDSYQQDRTELLILVIPYVIRDHKEAEEITEQFKRQLDLLL